MGEAPDHIEREMFTPLGDTPIVVTDVTTPLRAFGQALVIGVDHEGACPTIDETRFDILLSTRESAPRPWTYVSARGLADRIATLTAAVRRTPHAASVLRQVLRLNEALPFNEALIVESLAYSTLLGGGEFRAWRTAHPADLTTILKGKVQYAREGDHVTLTLSSPETRNAMSASMRDALCEALSTVLDDPSAPNVTLIGAGDCFSVGGDLNEFATNCDLAQAHTIRTMRSVAALIHELGHRIQILFHGACIGSGVEAAAAAERRTATDNAFFQMPELKMGLIPGAGGTVTLPRAIGRHRACAMMVSGARVSAATALQWGLIQEIAPRP